MRGGSLVVLVAAATLAGCATPSYARVLDSWKGATESDLVASWGPPDEVYQAPNGDRMLVFTRNDGALYLGTSPGAVGMALAVWCKTTFTIGPSGAIIRWRTDGNNCEGAPPGLEARGGPAAKQSSAPEDPSESTPAGERGP